jgi:phage terminase large subunit
LSTTAIHFFPGFNQKVEAIQLYPKFGQRFLRKWQTGFNSPITKFSLQDPQTWAYTRPILRENGGWAVFNFTPRGKNHAHELYLMAKNTPEWFCQKLTVEQTFKEDGKRIISEEDLDKERAEEMSEHLIQQEYYCSFDQGIEGAYYAKLLNRAELDGRLTNVPADSYASVDTYWDLGISDETVILFAQNCGQELHIIDMYRNQGEGLNHYAKVLKEKADVNNWNYGDHYAPHDIQVRELGSGAQTRLETHLTQNAWYLD